MGKDMAIVNENGKMYYYTPDKELVALASGDILSSSDKIVNIKDDKVKTLESDELITKDNKLIYVDQSTGQTHTITDGEIVSINGTAMKMHDGVLKPLASSSNDIKDGSYIAQSDNGNFKYFLKQHGQLIPVEKDALENGTEVLLNKMPLIFKDGDLYEKEQINIAVLTKKDLNTALIGDYILKAGNYGTPVYFQKRKTKNVIVTRKDIPDYALVYLF